MSKKKVLNDIVTISDVQRLFFAKALLIEIPYLKMNGFIMSKFSYLCVHIGNSKRLFIIRKLGFNVDIIAL